MDTPNLPPQFDIMVTNECNARCRCCIQEATFRSDTVDAGTFLSELQGHLDRFCSLGGQRVILTGGEPLVEFSLVLDILALVQRFPDLKMVALYTNGSLLLRKDENSPLTFAERLARAGLGSVGLSVHHHLDWINNKLLGMPRKTSTSTIASELRRCNLPFRFNLVLQQGGIASANDLLAYVDLAFALGATDVYVREMARFSFDAPLCASSRGAIEYSSSHRVSVDELAEQLRVAPGIAYLGARSEQFRDKREMQFRHRASGKHFYLSRLVVGSESEQGVPYLVLMRDARLYRGWLGVRDEIRGI